MCFVLCDVIGVTVMTVFGCVSEFRCLIMYGVVCVNVMLFVLNVHCDLMVVCGCVVGCYICLVVVVLLVVVCCCCVGVDCVCGGSLLL